MHVNPTLNILHGNVLPKKKKVYIINFYLKNSKVNRSICTRKTKDNVIIIYLKKKKCYSK